MINGKSDFSRLAELTSGLGLHEHLCLIYETQEEQFAAALPYLRTGLEQCERCLYVVDENNAAAVLDALRKDGTDVDRYLRSGALTINHKEETYLKLGRFDPDGMIAFLSQAIADAGTAKCSRLRTLLGEMTWVLGTSTEPAKLIEYESKLNRFVRDHDITIVCQYNRAKFSPELILNVVRTHPLVVYGGTVAKNPFYVPPDELTKPNQAAREVERVLRNILTWERTAQAVRQSEEALRSVLDTTPALIHTGRPDGYLDYFNQRWLDYVGRSLEEVQGLGWTASIHPQDVKGCVDQWRASLASGEPYQYEARVRRADGAYLWMLLRKVPLRNGQGNIVKWYGTGSDIEDLKRAEDRIRIVIDAIPTMAWSVRPDGVVDFLNQRWKDYSGLSLEEYVDEPTRIIHPDDIPRIMGKWRAALAAGEPYEDEMRLRWADGEYRWFLIRTAPLHDEQGKIAKWYGSATDIEDRKRAEEALRDSEERFRTTFEAAGIGIALIDKQGQPIRCNPTLQKMLGFTSSELARMAFVEFTHPDDRELDWGLYSDLVAGKRDRYEIEKRYIKKHGQVMWGLLIVSLVRSADGAPQYAVGMVEDITERKQAEGELQRSHDQLRSLAARLRTVQEEERTRLARELHDELGSELTGLKWDIGMLAKTCMTALDEAHLEVVSEKLKSIIERVDASFNTVRRIASDLRPRMLDDLGLLEAVEWQAQQFQARSGITCDCDFAAVKFPLNREQNTAVFRIFQEALTNVLRHAQATRVDIGIRQDAGEFVMTIRDNGRGIAEDKSSAHLSLGLLGMQERAHLAGGRIEISGSEEQGTRVTVRIPISSCNSSESSR